MVPRNLRRGLEVSGWLDSYPELSGSWRLSLGLEDHLFLWAPWAELFLLRNRGLLCGLLLRDGFAGRGLLRGWNARCDFHRGPSLSAEDGGERPVHLAQCDGDSRLGL